MTQIGQVFHYEWSFSIFKGSLHPYLKDTIHTICGTVFLQKAFFKAFSKVRRVGQNPKEKMLQLLAVTSCNRRSFLVPKRRLELPRRKPHQNLNLACLPIPPLRHRGTVRFLALLGKSFFKANFQPVFFRLYSDKMQSFKYFFLNKSFYKQQNFQKFYPS